jgi:hypothetical protein
MVRRLPTDPTLIRGLAKNTDATKKGWVEPSACLVGCGDGKAPLTRLFQPWRLQQCSPNQQCSRKMGGSQDDVKGLNWSFECTPHRITSWKTWWGRKGLMYWWDQHYYILLWKFPQSHDVITWLADTSTSTGWRWRRRWRDGIRKLCTGYIFLRPVDTLFLFTGGRGGLETNDYMLSTLWVHVQHSHHVLNM